MREVFVDPFARRNEAERAKAEREKREQIEKERQAIITGKVARELKQKQPVVKDNGHPWPKKFYQ